jgi:peroxiredoxin Q/BCP
MAHELQLNLKEGDIAPPFTAATNGGGRISLSDYKGKNVILYFYPQPSHNEGIVMPNR